MTPTTIELNGHPASFENGTTVAELVAQRSSAAGDGERRGRGVAVAVNGEVVPRSSWADTVLCAGDRVELLNAVGGG